MVAEHTAHNVHTFIIYRNYYYYKQKPCAAVVIAGSFDQHYVCIKSKNTLGILQRRRAQKTIMSIMYRVAR